MTRTKDLIRYKKTGFGKGRRTEAAQGLDYIIKVAEFSNDPLGLINETDYIIEVAEFSNDPLGLMDEAPEVHKEFIVEAPKPLS